MSNDEKIFTYYKKITKPENTQINFDDLPVFFKMNQKETLKCRELYKDFGKKSEEYSKFKAYQLPSVTFNSSMGQGQMHSMKNTIRLSEYVHLDYDELDMEKFEIIKECLRSIKHTALIFNSPSGVGLKVIVKVKFTDRENVSQFLPMFHTVDRFYTAEIAHQTGLNIKSDHQCSDYSRCCFLCYDPLFYYNPKATYFKKPKEQDIISEIIKDSTFILTSKEQKLLEKLVEIICKQKIDITEEYTNWVRCGFVVRNIMGQDNKEIGLAYFDKISQFYKNYNSGEVSKKWDSIFSSKDDGNKVKIPSLIKIMEKYGMTIFFTPEEMKTIRENHVRLEDCVSIMTDEGFVLEYCVIKRKRILKYKNKVYIVDESGNDCVHFIRNWFLDNYSFDISNTDVDMIINGLPRKEYNFVKDILEKHKTTDTSEIEKVLECFIPENKDKESLVDGDQMLMRFLLGCIHNWLRTEGQRKYDEMLILRSDHSIGKTDLINNFLFKIFKSFNGIVYLTESTNFFENSKDLIYGDHTSLINYKPELSNQLQKKTDAIKSYTSKSTFTIRRPYMKTEETFMSYCSFIADTNNVYFLPDDINLRRFLILNLDSLTFMKKDEYPDTDDGKVKWIVKDINWFKFWGSLYQMYLNGSTFSDFYTIVREQNYDNVATDRDDQIIKNIIAQGEKTDWIHIDDLIPSIESMGYKLGNTSKQSLSNSLQRNGFKNESKWNSKIKKPTRGFYNIRIDNTHLVQKGVFLDENGVNFDLFKVN